MDWRFVDAVMLLIVFPFGISEACRTIVCACFGRISGILIPHVIADLHVGLCSNIVVYCVAFTHL